MTWWLGPHVEGTSTLEAVAATRLVPCKGWTTSLVTTGEGGSGAARGCQPPPLDGSDLGFSVLLQLDEEEERRKRRREKNKVAAARCRNKKKERTEFLQRVGALTWRWALGLGERGL